MGRLIDRLMKKGQMALGRLKDYVKSKGEELKAGDRAADFLCHPCTKEIINGIDTWATTIEGCCEFQIR